MASTNPDFSIPTCRICLQNIKDQEMLSIFDLDEDLDDIFIYEKIEECAGIKVLHKENLPNSICDNCYGLLSMAYQFRIICRNSEERLKEFLAKNTKTEHSSQQNPLSIKEDSSKEKGTLLKAKKCLTNVSRQTQQCLENEINISGSSPTNFEEHIEDSFEDCVNDVMYFETNYDDNDIHGDEDTHISMENTHFDVNDKTVKPSRKMKSHKRKKITKVKNKKSKVSTICDEDELTDAKTPRAEKIQKEKGSHICEICGNKFKHRYSLKGHIKRHLNEKAFNCEICGYSCHSNIELVRHLRRHTGSKPYKCRYCTRAFGDQSTLVKHERVHRNERPFKCDICGKSFSYTGVLNCHKLVHTGEKPYKCEICGKCFTTRHHLRSHLKTIQHQNDSRVMTLLQNIRKNNETISST